MDTENKSCMTCEHYMQYYVKILYSFRTIDYGHCKRPRKMLRTESSYCCQYWIDGSEKKESQKIDAKEKLLAISKRLNKLADVIEFD